MRRRVGDEWEWALNDETRLALIGQIEAEQKAFFGTVGQLHTAIAQESVDELLGKYSMGNPPARAALHLARAAAFLGHTATNHALVERGLTLAASHATGLIHDLRTAGQVDIN
jgi:hypothetical protein